MDYHGKTKTQKQVKNYPLLDSVFYAWTLSCHQILYSTHSDETARKGLLSPFCGMNIIILEASLSCLLLDLFMQSSCYYYILWMFLQCLSILSLNFVPSFLFINDQPYCFMKAGIRRSWHHNDNNTGDNNAWSSSHQLTTQSLYNTMTMTMPTFFSRQNSSHNLHITSLAE